MPAKKNSEKHSAFDKHRRKLLKFLGLSSAALVSDAAFSQVTRPVTIKPIGNIKVDTNTNIKGVAPTAKYITVKLLRPQDMLALELRFYNFTYSNKQLKRNTGAAYVVVLFEPQTIGEQSGKEDASGLHMPNNTPSRAILADKSRLVFRVPEGMSTIPLTVESLLAWDKLNLNVNPRAKDATLYVYIPQTSSNTNYQLYNFDQKTAKPATRGSKISTKGLSKDEKAIYKNNRLATTAPGRRTTMPITIVNGITGLVAEKMQMPDEMETSLEVPLRMFLSPPSSAVWKHATKLNAAEGLIKKTNKIFELWHTRLSNTNNTADETRDWTDDKIVRALWAADANPDLSRPPAYKNEDESLGLTSINANQRHFIVHESSNFQVPNFSPQPVRAKKLFLSSLGAWLDSQLLVERKKMMDAGFNGVLKWRHIETMAREHYVEIVEAGNIMPFGHEAVLITITERKPHLESGTAANFQRKLVVITEHSKDYNYRDSKGQFMQFPFVKVEMLTTVSPLLDSNKTKLAGGIDAENQFVIKSANKPVLYKVRAEDMQGNITDFQIPIAYVSSKAYTDGSNNIQHNLLQQIIDGYNNASGMQVINKTAAIDGKKITLAPSHPNGVNTAFETREVTFAVKKYTDDPTEPQLFLPVLNFAKIIEPSYQRLTGIATPVEVSMVDDKNDGQVFAKFLQSAPVNFSGQSDKTGGFAAPNFNLSGLSKVAGAFGGKFDDFVQGKSDPLTYFNVGTLPDPKLFGVFKLSEILNFGNTVNALKIETAIKDRIPTIPNMTVTEDDDTSVTSYKFSPLNIKEKTIGIATLKFDQQDKSFSIDTSVTRYKKDPSKKPEFKTTAYVKNFSVNLFKAPSDKFGLMYVEFDKIAFTVNSNSKVDIDINMKGSGVQFGGPLSFINEFVKLIPQNGFSDPPYLDVTPAGVKSGYTLALPNLQLGAFTLSNLSLSADVNLPFTGAPLTIGFRFCERQQPFTLTVGILGGGGFFGIEADLTAFAR